VTSGRKPAAREQKTEGFECGSGNAECGKKKMRYSILDWAFGIVDFDKENV
jgi:hypothetical protein